MARFVHPARRPGTLLWRPWRNEALRSHAGTGLPGPPGSQEYRGESKYDARQ